MVKAVIFSRKAGVLLGMCLFQVNVEIAEQVYFCNYRGITHQSLLIILIFDKISLWLI